MPRTLSLYLDRNGVKELLAFISDEPELAFILPTKPNAWRAVNRVEMLRDGVYAIWHEPGGPLRMVRTAGGGRAAGTSRAGRVEISRSAVIENPWAGWVEKGARAGSATPDASFPSVFLLRLRTQGVVSGQPGVSEIYWIGNHYRRIGRPADPSTTRCWNRLRRWFDKQMTLRLRGK